MHKVVVLKRTKKNQQGKAVQCFWLEINKDESKREFYSEIKEKKMRIFVLSTSKHYHTICVIAICNNNNNKY